MSYSEDDRTEDMKVLHGMGYAQELQRNLSRFSNFAISFSIICILSGGINSLAQATSGSGGIGIGIGWLVGCFVSLVFAVAMSQISSAYPDGRRPLSLGLDPRQPRHRLGDRLAEPARPDHRARRHQRRHLDLLHGGLRRGARHREHHHHPDDLPDHHHRRPGADQSHGHPADGAAHRLLRLADLRRLDPDRHRLPRRRRHLGLRAAVHLQELFRRGRRQRLAGGLERLGLRARPLAADLHYHRLRRLGAYLRGDAQGRAFGAAGDGDVGGLVGALRLSVPGRLRGDDSRHGPGRGAGLERVLLGVRPAGERGR